MSRAHRILVPVLLLACLGLLPAQAEPQEDFRLEARIPATTLAFAAVEDVASWGPHIEATALGKMMADPEMQAFMAPIAEALQEMVKGGMAQVPPVVVELLGQLEGIQGQVAIALVDVDMESELPHLVASLDFGGQLDRFATFLDKMRQEMDPDGQQIRTREEDGRTWWTVEGSPIPIHATTVDSAFVAATDIGLLKQVVAGEATGSLAADEEFKTVMGRGTADKLGILIYGNVDAALVRFGDMIPDEARKIAYVLGLDTVASVSYAMEFKGDGFRDTIAIHAPDADHGLVPLLQMEPLTAPRTLDLAPAKTFWWSEANLPLADLMPRVRSLVSQIDPDAAEQMDQGLQQLQQVLGVDLEKEVLGGLADTLGGYVALPVGGGLYPEVALAFVVKDPAAYEGVFDRLSQGIAGLLNEEGDILAATRTLVYHGVKMHLFEMQRARGKKIVPFTPTWALMGDRLVLTLVPHTMKELILRVQGVTSASGLSTQPDFQSLMALKPAGAGSVEYVNLKSILALLYDTGVPLLQTLVKPNVLGNCPVPLDWALLPPSSRVLPHFRSMADYLTWNKDGMSISLQGPIPMLPMIAVGAGAAAFLTVGRMSEAPFATAGAEVPQTHPLPVRVVRKPGRSIDDEMDLELAKIQAEMLYEAVDFFRTEKKRLPNALGELVEAGLRTSIPKDPWGNPYQMQRSGPDTFVVQSAGPDKNFGTPDDVRHGK